MKNRNCLSKFDRSFRPVARGKITIVGSSESLLDVGRLRRVQAAQSGTAVTASFDFCGLRKIEERNAASEHLVYDALRYAVIFQIDEAEVLKRFTHTHSCSLTQRRVTSRETSEIDNRNFFTGAQFQSDFWHLITPLMRYSAPAVST